MKIAFANIQYQYQLYKNEIDKAIQNALDKSHYIMGEEVAQLESALEKFTGTKYAMTCSLGIDALLLAMMALDIKPGDEIITTPFTFIAGDGGAIFTNDESLAIKMKQLIVHGQNKRYHHEYIGIGIGGRMDTIQCAIVNVKLKYLALRQEVTSKYTQVLEGRNLILPHIDKDFTSSFTQYSVKIKNFDEIQARLKDQGIPTAVHYKMPLHLQECFEYLGYKKGDFPIAETITQEIMSLPMNLHVSGENIKNIAENLVSK
ncbi:DegT/DnrJ/EryC1/StrS family aminotransferase [Sulfurimonas sp. SAG-AH-194-I05]|nr:DegT/DnrJ/EryC1/StrS family aminotransferase [Sulfurimonas sp. SAG-AH-194-I05]MDF1876087.1 DegT/DnrJ/EryC1/StrS family aminotransferase [Sulfurimonas sp. SAG-AH-194-I05]